MVHDYIRKREEEEGRAEGETYLLRTGLMTGKKSANNTRTIGRRGKRQRAEGRGQRAKNFENETKKLERGGRPMGADKDQISTMNNEQGLTNPSISASERSEEEGLLLRWSRIGKTVQVKDANSGLLRGSISTRDINNSKSGPFQKAILSEVSGCAAPGQVMAMMGPSGSGAYYLAAIVER